MPPPSPLRSWRTVAAVCLALLGAAFARSEDPAASPPLPAFTGYLSAPRDGTLFVLRWSPPQGGTFETLARLGERAGEFKLVEFDAKTETLAVADPQGRLHRLALPGGKVRPPEAARMADAEFRRLFQYLRADVDKSTAPILSREQARAFYQRLVTEKNVPTAPNVPNTRNVIIDLEGRMLSPEQAARWPESQARARAAGRLLLAAQIDGRTMSYEMPQRPYPFPEQMMRNLTEADWQEFGLIDAINSIKRSPGPPPK